ncbi:MAG: glycoside hydrolase [Nevskiales bacterium]|nr:glycoside hydrolase [Nevskiales bacterium]
MDKVLVFPFLAALLATGAVGEGAPAPPGPSEVRYEPLVPEGEIVNQGGLYDPSLEYDRAGKVGWLAYSAIRNGGQYGFPVGPYIHTHLARTADGGRTWRFVGAANRSGDEAIPYVDGTVLRGVWRYEVPSLVHDPDDPGREWKLFTHRYFWTEKYDRMPAYGWIAYRHASDPAGNWSEEVPLFGAGPFPPPPYDQTVVRLNALHPTLAKVVAYTEPGALYLDGVLYLSLTALSRKGPERIILSASRDHGRTWEFLGTLVTRQDAKALGYRNFDGSSLAREGDRTFLLVTPESKTTMHDGTLIVEFSDLKRAELKRTVSGTLNVHRHLRRQTAPVSKSLGAGQSDYDQYNAHGGVVMPQADFRAAPQLFQLFSTRQSLTGD